MVATLAKTDIAAKLAMTEVSVNLGGRPILRRVTLQVRAGEVVALVGPNGCGKSTTVRIAAGLLKPASGQVEVDGVPLGDWDRRKLARRLACLPQTPLLPPLYNVREAVALGRTPFLSFLGVEGAADRAVVETSLRQAGVLELAERRVGELSGGERQRVAFARALAQSPRCLLLDEPTSSLDLRHEEGTLALLREMAAGGDFCALVVLHDLTVAAHFCDRVILMNEGEVIASGAPAEVLAPGRLREVYGTELAVLAHPATGRPIVVHQGGPSW